MENDQLKNNYEILKEQYEKITNNNKKNIVKDTQASVDLKLGDGVNLSLINSANENKDLLKLSKLKYLTKNKELKTKENLNKYILRIYYNTLHLKNSNKNKTEENNKKIDVEKYKKLKNLIVKKEKDIKNIIRNKYMIYYFKGKINEMQINNNNNNDDNEKKDLINNVNNIESIENKENKENKQIDNENEKNENNI